MDLDDVVIVAIGKVTEPAERLSADDFIEKMRTSLTWYVVHGKGRMDPMELYVKEDDEVRHYLPPDFLEMPIEEVRRFFAIFNEVTQGPGTLSAALNRDRS